MGEVGRSLIPLDLAIFNRQYIEMTQDGIHLLPPEQLFFVLFFLIYHLARWFQVPSYFLYSELFILRRQGTDILVFHFLVYNI